MQTTFGVHEREAVAPYNADFPVGSTVTIAEHAVLAGFAPPA